VLEPGALRVSRSLRKAMRREPYRITVDRDFSGVIDACGRTPRPEQDGTWITDEMREAYVELHRRGVAHSVEAWESDRLVGGVYGLSLGRTFFGESMFAHRPDASKIAFVRLVTQLQAWSFDLIDCQVVTEHLVRFGAHEIDLDDFLERLERSVAHPTRRGPWTFDER
jgi:leucyl/phenylalanyl-tRNA--protein transferase